MGMIEPAASLLFLLAIIASESAPYFRRKSRPLVEVSPDLITLCAEGSWMEYQQGPVDFTTRRSTTAHQRLRRFSNLAAKRLSRFLQDQDKMGFVAELVAVAMYLCNFGDYGDHRHVIATDSLEKLMNRLGFDSTVEDEDLIRRAFDEALALGNQLAAKAIVTQWFDLRF